VKLRRTRHSLGGGGQADSVDPLKPDTTSETIPAPFVAASFWTSPAPGTGRSSRPTTLRRRHDLQRPVQVLRRRHRRHVRSAAAGGAEDRRAAPV